jgi:hypothetical protein
MIVYYDFGKRRETPCFDCDQDGHCTMNCGPQVICSRRLIDEGRKRTDAVRGLRASSVGGRR